MIKILNKWSEIGYALKYLTAIGKDKRTRVYHSTPIKNWDLAQVAKIIMSRSRNIKILDMGCGGSNVLRLCYKQRFMNLYGIDLVVNFHDRLQQFMFWKNNSLKIPYHLGAQSVTNTNFQDRFFDVLICLSVVEHHVNIKDFLNEASRLLKSGGVLYLSTDYHETKIKTDKAPLNYEKKAGDWNIFSKSEIFQLIQLAKKYNLVLKSEKIPKMSKPLVNWNTMEYTFLSLVFHKSK